MAILDFVHSRTVESSRDNGSDDKGSAHEEGEEKQVATTDMDGNLNHDSDDGESIQSAQEGVKKARATTIVWTRKALVIAYALYVQ